MLNVVFVAAIALVAAFVAWGLWIVASTCVAGTARALGWTSRRGVQRQWADAKQRAAHGAPNRRRWALAIADIVALRNGLPCDTDSLSAALPDEQRRRLAQQVLREMDVSPKGTADEVAQRVQLALRAWVSGFGRSLDGFYHQLAAQGQVRDALAFECARTAFLVRCTALLGWVPERDAWLVLFLNAQRAQDSFRSWEDFGTAYARARLEWLRSSEQDGPASLRATAEVQARLQDPAGNWAVLPWNRYAIFDPQPVDTGMTPT